MFFDFSVLWIYHRFIPTVRELSAFTAGSHTCISSGITRGEGGREGKGGRMRISAGISSRSATAWGHAAQTNYTPVYHRPYPKFCSSNNGIRNQTSLALFRSVTRGSVIFPARKKEIQVHFSSVDIIFHRYYCETVDFRFVALVCFRSLYPECTLLSVSQARFNFPSGMFFFVFQRSLYFGQNISTSDTLSFVFPRGSSG